MATRNDPYGQFNFQVKIDGIIVVSGNFIAAKNGPQAEPGLSITLPRGGHQEFCLGLPRKGDLGLCLTLPRKPPSESSFSLV